MSKVYIYSQKDGWLDKEGLFLFDKPVFRLKYINGDTYINNHKLQKINPLILIEKIINKYNLYGVGYISYNFGKNLVLGKRYPQIRDINLPDIYVLFFKNYKPIKNSKTDLKNVVKDLKFRTSKESYIKKVLKAKEYIEAGNIYQINLTYRIDLEGFFFPENTFFRLIDIQKAPFLMLIKDRDFSVLSASMELFLEKKENLIITKPIKGTRPRGKTLEEDRRLYEQLKNSDKEIAENLMITDLMRNDLGRISNKVYVKDLFKVDKYTTLYQMSSTIVGKLKEGIRFKDIVYNTFPPGSITGAPKKMAMEIIATLEDTERSIYCGSLFLIKPNLDFKMSVAIRQSIFKDNKCYTYVGSGIVHYSIPEEEFKETLVKAKANLKALGVDSIDTYL